MPFEPPLIQTLSTFLSGGTAASNTCDCTGSGVSNQCTKSGEGGVANNPNNCYKSGRGQSNSCSQSGP